MHLLSGIVKTGIEDKDVSAKKYYKWYTFCFIVMSVFVYSVFLYNGKSFVYCDIDQGGDGLVQHYNSFVYYGRYLRKIIKTLLFEHRLVIPMWDMSIGYGQDIITTLSYYVVGDPFSALSVFIPTRFSEFGYSFLIWLRLYCAGAAFSAYCRYRGQRSYMTLVGSILYTFSFYGLVAPILHPYFALPMIYLPLLLIGVEKMLLEKKKCFYTGIVALAAISNFYFFFMLCIMVVLYTAFRYVEIYEKIEVKQILRWIGVFILYSGIGILMASVLFIPSVLNILGASRVSVENYIPIVYELSYYLKLIPAFVNDVFEIEGYYTYTGYTVLGLLAVIILILKRKEKREYTFLTAGFAMLMLFLMIPFAGHVFNGLGYVTNRWVWGLAMLVAYIVVRMLPELKNVGEKQWKTIFIVCSVYSGIILICNMLRSEKNLLTILEIIVVLTISYYFSHRRKETLCVVVNLVMAVVLLSVNAYYCYSPLEGNYIENFADRGEAYKLLTEKSPAYVLKKVEDEDLYRFDTAAIPTGKIKRNSTMLLDMNGVAYYYSSTNDTVTKFNTDLFLNYSMDQTYDSLDRRSMLETLFGVKYVVIPNGFEQYLPYGYDQEVLSKKGYTVYAKDTVMPIGFTSDTYMDSDDYDKLGVVQKQEALMQTIIIEGETSLEEADVSYSSSEIPYTVTEGNGVQYKDGKFIVSKENATVTLEFENVSNCELYLVWDNLSFESQSPYSFYTSEDWEEMSTSKRNELKRKEKEWTEATGAKIKVESGDVYTTVSYKTWKDNYYCAHTDFIANLGYAETERNTITLNFSQTGEYTFDQLDVVSQPMEAIDENVQRMSEECLENVEIADNEIKGTITLDSEKLLCLQIPYNSGWRAYVDGKETEILKADGIFMGVELSEGTHSITFRYSTPNLGISMGMSGIGVVVYGVMLIMSRRKKTKII